MCGACVSDDMAGNTRAQPRPGPPPKSPYYESHFPKGPSLRTRILAWSMPCAILVAILASVIWYVNENVGITEPAIQDVPLEERLLIPPEEPLPNPLEEEPLPFALPMAEIEPPIPPEKKRLKIWSAKKPYRRQVGIPLGLNLTRRAEPFWQGFRELLLLDNSTAEEGGWFDHVNDDTIRIAEMWSKVEKPDAAGQKASKGALSQKQYDLMERDIHVREAALRNISIEFSWFLGNQTLITREFLRGGAVIPSGVSGLAAAGISDDQLGMIGPHVLGYTNGSVDSNGTTKPPLKLSDPTTYTDEAAGPPVRIAGYLMGKLVRQHAKLVAPLEPAGVGSGGFGVERICFAMLPMARMAEERFVQRLVAASSQGALWQARKSVDAVRTLERRICGIHHTHAEMRRALAWLENRFPSLRGPAVVDDDEDGAGDALVDTKVKGYLDKAVIRDGRGKKKVVPELFVWVKSAVELLGAWSTVLMDVQEGLLIAMRQRELRRQAREWEGGEGEQKAPFGTQEDYEESWRQWKQRNCGATSCYEQTSAKARLKHVLAPGHGRPLANDAWDEHKYLGWDIGIWKGVYEEACCGKGTLANVLKFGQRTPRFLAEDPHAHKH